MSHNVQLPALGESVTEGTVTRWLKAVGERVEVDEPLLEISTDKVDTEIPSPVAGVIEQILVPEDETAEVGAVLAVIGDGTGSAPAPAEPAAPAQAEPVAQAPVAQAPVAPAEEAVVPVAEPAAPTASAPAAADATPITLPALGESVTEGTVTRWLKAVGDHVDVDEPLLEISTDKVDTEVPSPVGGTLLQILVPEDETAEVGAVLALIGSGAPLAASPVAPEPAAAAPVAEQPVAEQPVAPAPVAPTRPAEVAPAAPVAPPAASAAVSTATTAIHGGYLTPLVRKLAAELGVDTAALTGTGVGGRIRKEDVLAAAEARQTAVPEAAAPTAACTKNGRNVSLAPSRVAKPSLALVRRRATRVTSTSTTVVS
ncbi:MAG: E3 binding domain-containing protein [Actinobacteria bacterium]|nr:E3 binding domain-containing protein [Actinomycetota bacterium]